MSTHITTVAVISPETHSETRNGQPLRSYPPPTALYQDVLQNPQIFWEKLRAFHSSFSSKFTVPTVGGRSLDLHQLFVEVTSRGGLEKVIRDRRWKEVIAAFNFPSTITSASFVLRKYYLSLLYHFEQVYLFQKQGPSVSAPVCTDTLDENLVIGSTTPDEDVTMNPIPGIEQLGLGSSVAGTIDGKFDTGYLVTVNLGPDQLKGVLYHIPNAFDTSNIPARRQRKRSRLLLQDPSKPKSNRSGYNFFFAEHYAKLKPLYHGEEKMISKKIGELWNNLTEQEKQFYQEKGMEDKERYKSEMLEYRSCRQ